MGTYGRGKHPNSLANLAKTTRPGRPKSPDCLISCIKEELARISEDGTYTNEQHIAIALVNKAKLGDSKAIEIVMSYTTPKPAQGINLGAGEGGSPVIRVIYDASKPVGGE